MSYDNSNSGALFKNETKKGSSDRDYNGTLEIDCPHCGAKSEHWVSAWINTAKSTGKKYMSMKFTPKEPAQQTSAADDFDDDDIPF